MPNRYALLIGNSEYSDSKLTRLRTPDSDVNTLADVLRNQGMGNFDEVEVLLNQDSALVRKTISMFFSNKKRDDLLLLYFSGHGVLDDRGLLFLAMKDTEYHLLRGTSLSANFITDEMDNSNSKQQILILDCCHSGAFARSAKGVIGKSVGTSSAFMGNGFGRVVLTATDSMEYAWEGDELLGSKQNSVFTHYLIKGIETGQADLNQDGMISIDELYDFTHDSVNSSTSKQTPGKWTFRQQGEIFIAKNPFLGASASEIQASRLFKDARQSELIGPSLSAEFLKWGIIGGLIAVLLLIYPLYIYLPSLYVSGWRTGYAVLAFMLTFAALVPPGWSGWQMARRAKSGWEAVFLGSQSGAVASAIAFLCIISMSSEIYAFGPVLKLLPTRMGINQINAVLASPMIAVFNEIMYIGITVELVGLFLGALGSLLNLRRSGKIINFSGFSLMFDMQWWKLIVAGMFSAVLIHTISSPLYNSLVDEVNNTARVAGYHPPAIDQAFLNWFPSLPALMGLLSMMILGCIFTLGRVPDKPSQQRVIALCAIIAALIPWLNPVLGHYTSYWVDGNSSTVYWLIALLCAAPSTMLLFFAGKLIKKSGWGKLESTSGRAFMGGQVANALLFGILATPAITVGVFYIIVIQILDILNGSSSITVMELMTKGFEIQALVNLILIILVLILYTVLGLLLKLLLWVFNGIVDLFSTPDVAEKPAQESVLDKASPLEESASLSTDGGSKEKDQLNAEDIRLFKAAGLILGLLLLFMFGFRFFPRSGALTAFPLQPTTALYPSMDLFATSTLDLFATYTPVIAQATATLSPTANPATQTVGAAFTQIAVISMSSGTTIPSATSTATVTPITTLTPTGAMLQLEKTSACREGPASDYEEIVWLASDVELPILASSSEHEGWWLIIVRLSLSTNAVCWIEGGIVEGDSENIPAIVYTP